MFDSFKRILQARQQIRSSNDPSNLSQGSTLPISSLSPYSLADTFTYGLGFLFGDRVSINQCRTVIPGRSLTDHVIGVKTGKLNKASISTSEQVDEALRVIFAGDLMVSKSGLSIQLTHSLIETICNADVFVINVESPVSLSTTPRKRGGLDFSMSKSYLKDFIDQLKQHKPELIIVYDIANNHSLDGRQSFKETPAETAMMDLDADNFPLLRTVAAIRDIDPKGIIIGAHLAEEEYRHIVCSDGQRINCYAEPFGIVTDRQGKRYGFIGFTDILNHNAHSWDKRVVRTEDIPSDLEAFKKHYHLEQLYLVGHGNLEQCIYPRKAWRDKTLQFLSRGADALFGHGPHVPLTNEVLHMEGRSKFIAHSLGNFYGPTNLGNTGLNSLVEYTVYSDNSAQFSMLPVEATHDSDNRPMIGSNQDSTQYPHLLARFQTLYPLDSIPVLFSVLQGMDSDALSEPETEFIKQLHQLREVSDGLHIKNYHHAANAADKLYSDLVILFSQYKCQQSKEAYLHFKKLSLDAIAIVDHEFSHYHQLKKILLNLAIAVLSLGLAFPLHKIAKGRYTFFSQHILSGQLETLEKTLNQDSMDHKP